jgi:phage replication-related protein YjqB (UPF0714/DUF867 family)
VGMTTLKMADQYSCYADLRACEPEGTSFRIRVVERNSAIAIIAPHGGRIEPGTSETAALIAGEYFSLYCFESLISGRRLHITSARFDEPRGLALVEASRIAIAVHGRADAADPKTIWMGGLHLQLRDEIGGALERAGFPISLDHHMQGKHPSNICNRGRLRAGIQIELPRSLRNSLRGDADAREAFASAVRGPLLEWEQAQLSVKKG